MTTYAFNLLSEGVQLPYAYRVGAYLARCWDDFRLELSSGVELCERRSDTDLVHHVSVYRINGGFWDCYGDELQAA